MSPRSIEVKQGQNTVGKYEYDGLNRRIKKHQDTDAPDEPDDEIDQYVHYFYNSSWQVLETRTATSESSEPENLQPQYQYVWSLRYIDAPVLRDENTDEDGECVDERLYYWHRRKHERDLPRRHRRRRGGRSPRLAFGGRSRVADSV